MLQLGGGKGKKKVTNSRLLAKKRKLGKFAEKQGNLIAEKRREQEPGFLQSRWRKGAGALKKRGKAAMYPRAKKKCGKSPQFHYGGKLTVHSGGKKRGPFPGAPPSKKLHPPPGKKKKRKKGVKAVAVSFGGGGALGKGQSNPAK